MPSGTMGDCACPRRDCALKCNGGLCLPTEWCMGTLDPEQWYFDHGGTLTTKHLLPDPTGGQAYKHYKSLTSQKVHKNVNLITTCYIFIREHL